MNNIMQKKRRLPELLAPAGSSDALKAAIESGADAVYMGGAAFNARINAKNFTPEEQKEAIEIAHAYGVKVYIAANTLIFDKEREDYLRAAEQAYLFGADALIVADIGMARELSRRIPIELHASTQLSGHNLSAAQLLAEAGFSRMVCAREMSSEDIRLFCKHSPIEAEVFVHGALCVSTSGQCLFSSVVGGRSGNRGECAQPCRLPYTVGGKESYPLSLRDLSLAEHICELFDMGVSSLKIEGRMKSPEYVRDVTRIWRSLLDAGRDATPADMKELAKIFSRGGFTDGYYTKKVNSSMLGVRSDNDKTASAESAVNKFDRISRKIPITFRAVIKEGSPALLEVAQGDIKAFAEGQIPERAINAPIDKQTVIRNLSKLGATPYELSGIEVELGEGLMMPISALNALRRAAISALAEKKTCPRSPENIKKAPLAKIVKEKTNTRTALFYNAEQIPDGAEKYFDIVYVPLEDYKKASGRANGVMLPETIFDSQSREVEALLGEACELGAEHVLLGNVGHISLVQDTAPQLTLHGDFRLNVCNSSSAEELIRFGFEDFLLSPELGLAQMRDIGGKSRTAVYGRLPLMLTEKCIGQELGGCEKCKNEQLELCDRRGVVFPIRKRFGHRSIIFNSVPVYMADKKNELAKYKIFNEHFIFTIENKNEVSEIIEAYKNEKPPKTDIKRIR